MQFQGTESDASLASSPLEQLDVTLQQLPSDQAYSLKRELLVGMAPESPADLLAGGASSMSVYPIEFVSALY